MATTTAKPVTFTGLTKDLRIGAISKMPATDEIEITDGTEVRTTTVGEELASLKRKDLRIEDPLNRTQPIPATPEALAAMTLPRTETVLCIVRNLSVITPKNDDGSDGDQYALLHYVDKDGNEGRFSISTFKKNSKVPNPMFVNNKEMFANEAKISLTLEHTIGGTTQYESNGYIHTHNKSYSSMSRVLFATDDERKLLSARINQQISDLKLDSFQDRLGKVDPSIRDAMAKIMAAGMSS